MALKQHGVFTKPGVARRIAYSPAEAVQLTYDGWTRIADQIAKLPARATAPAKETAKDAESEPATARTQRTASSK
jgi:hypothetical protein